MIEDIKARIGERKYIITLHAKKRMDERGVSSSDLVTFIMNGDINRRIPGQRAMSIGFDTRDCDGLSLSRCSRSLQESRENNYRVLAE